MHRHAPSSRSRSAAAVLFAATAAAATCACADVPVFTDHFNNGSVADSDTQPGFWSTLISGGGAASEGTGGAGSLLLNVTGADSGNQFPFTEIASPLENSFNFFQAPIVIQASGLNYGPNSDPSSLTQFTITTQALSNAGPNTEYPAQDAISLWVANPNNTNGQILLGLKEDSPNASTAFDRFEALGPIGRDGGPISYNGGQVHGVKLVISPTFYFLAVTHDASSTDTTQVTDSYNGTLVITPGAGPGWGTVTNPLGDNAINIESQLSGVSDPNAVNPFNVGSIAVSQFVTDYIGTGTGNWSDTNNWDDADVQHPNGDGSTSNVPNFAGANVNFGPAAAPTTVITDADETLGVLTINSAQPYTITVSGNGEGTIHLATSYTASQVNVLQGSHTIFSPLELHNDAVFTVSQVNSTLTAPTILAFTPATTNFTKAGLGKLVTSSLAMENLNINGGTLALDTGTNAASVSDVQALNIATTNNAWLATLDMTKNSMVIDYPANTASPLTIVANQIKSGFHNGAWNGTGIISSTAAAIAADSTNIHKTALGYAEASTLGITSFHGQGFDSTAVLIAYTYTGDTNLDGTVNSSDFANLAANYGKTSATWLQGDFNYDGTVNALDFNALATNYGVTPLSSPIAASALGSVVPEPALGSICLCIAFACNRGSFGRRFRKASMNM